MNESGKMLVRLLLFGGFVVLTALLGLLAGEWSVPKKVPVQLADLQPTPDAEVGDPVPSNEQDEEALLVSSTIAPPLYFSLAPNAEGVWDNALQQVALAAKAGVHRYVVPVQFQWHGDDRIGDALDIPRAILDVDPQASLVLRLDLNPDDTWIQENAEAVVGEKFPRLASRVWLDAVQSNLEALQGTIASSNIGEQILGYILTAFEGGNWHYPVNAFGTEEDLGAFRHWLSQHYDNDHALADAWQQEGITLETATFYAPGDGAVQSEATLLLPLSGAQQRRDALRYLSETMATTITLFAKIAKGISSSHVDILVPYGFTFEAGRSDAGHFALQTLLESDVDGFVSPVSNHDRGLGGVGGPMGPIDSARYHGKQWYLIDDTRTGMTRSESSGAMERMRGLRAQDIFHVQQRNFGLAFTHELGLFWSDPQGAGWLLDEEQWGVLGALGSTYAQYAAPASETQAAAPPTLMVVVDEKARLYTNDANPVARELLWKTRDAALGVGVSTHFALLSDVLSGNAPSAKVYLLLNAFTLNAEERALLDARVAKEKSCVIWVYAPGYADGEDPEQSISETTGMTVAASEDMAMAGSTFDMEGQWLKKGALLGERRVVEPLYFIEDEDVDVIARYQVSGRASAAIRFLEEGGASVYIADPQVTPILLREILAILELHVYLRSMSGNGDTVQVGNRMVMLHARGTGERNVDFNGTFNAYDILDETLAWPDKESILLPMTTGETRLLRLSAVGASPEQ